MTSMQRYHEALLNKAVVSNGRKLQKKKTKTNIFDRLNEIVAENTKKTKTQKSKKSVKSKKSQKSKKSAKTTTTTVTPTTTSTAEEAIVFPTAPPTVSPAPSISPAPTTSPQPSSSAPTKVNCDTGGDNFVGIIGTDNPVTALSLPYEYSLVASEDDTQEEVVDVIAPAVKDSIASYLASELFPVCAPVENSRHLISTTSFGTLDVERNLETTGIFTLSDDAEIIGICRTNLPNSNCFVLRDSVILLSNSTDEIDKSNDLGELLIAIQVGMATQSIALPQSVQGIAYRFNDFNDTNTTIDEGNQVVTNNDTSGSNTVFIAMGSTFGALLCIICACFMAKCVRGRNKYDDDSDEDSQASRDYSNVIGSQRYQHVRPSDDHSRQSGGSFSGRSGRNSLNNGPLIYNPYNPSGGVARGGAPQSRDEMQKLSTVESTDMDSEGSDDEENEAA